METETPTLTTTQLELPEMPEPATYDQSDQSDPHAPATVRMWTCADVPEAVIDDYIHLNSEFVGDMSRKEAKDDIRAILAGTVQQKLQVMTQYLRTNAAAKPALQERPRPQAVQRARTPNFSSSKSIKFDTSKAPTLTTDLLARLRSNAPVDLRTPASQSSSSDDDDADLLAVSKT